MPRLLLSAVLSLSVLLSTLVAAQDTSYTFTPIDVPGAAYTQAFGIDDRGRIVGMFYDGTRRHGFLKDGATFTTIDVPGAEHTEAWGINQTGQIVGWFSYATGLFHGFLKDGATFTTIDVPGAAFTQATGINTVGQIVGLFSDDATFTRFHGFLKDGATFTPIDVPGAEITMASRINETGQIVGRFRDATTFHGFLKDGTTFTTIDVPGAEHTEAWGVNNSGQIVGYFRDGTGTGVHGFLKDGATFTPIDVPGAAFTEALGINNSGQIVGLFSDGTTFHGFLATPVEEDTTPPVLTVSASPTTLWPPNGRLVTVTVSGRIADEPNGSGVSSATYRVMDEYGQIQPSGSVPLGADGRYAFTVALEASRRGNDRDGRQYMIVVSATDNAGSLGAASTLVTVPHDQGK